MKVLLCHNHYRQRGGEDRSFEDESWLLETHGHQVVRFTLRNSGIRRAGHLVTAWRTFWNRPVREALTQLIGRERPDLMHCTNTFPLISPSAYDAARRAGIPVVQALRNYRLLCPRADFFRDGRVCESCLHTRAPWPGVVHGCYRGSRVTTAVVAGMLSVHRAAGTWARQVSMYYTLTEFARRKFVEGGIPAERILLKSNFIRRPPEESTARRNYALFVGRLAPEKGVHTLLSAWERLRIDLPLKLLGDGPLRPAVEAAAARDSRIQWLGSKSSEEVFGLLRASMFLVCPSVWYETFGRVIAEAFATGTPAIVSRLGAMEELVSDGETGLLFEPGDAADLATKVEHLAAAPARRQRMGLAAAKEYEAKFTPESNYEALMRVYRQAQAVVDAAAPVRKSP